MTETIAELDKEIELLGYEIQSISFNLSKIGMEMKRERAQIMKNNPKGYEEKVAEWVERRDAFLVQRRRALDALNYRINLLAEKKRLKRELMQKARL